MSAQILTVICPEEAATRRFSETLEAATRGCCIEVLTCLDAKQPLRNRRILFAVSLNESGFSPSLCQLLPLLRSCPDYLKGSIAGVLVDGSGELYTKAVGRDLVLAANGAGCIFPGRPLVEAIGSLQNFTVQAKNAGCTLEMAYQRAVSDLIDRILAFEPSWQVRPKVVVLHASSYKTSNTMALWSQVKQALTPACDITEIGLRNGTMEDCSGCPYTMCLHFGEKGECFYGGVMVQEVYPAIREADALVMLCPNYNDALSANLTACINRLTALYRTISFDRKALLGIVVSGYSGGDIVAAQLVSALCMNKGFWLPPDFCLMETANDPGSALKLPGIEERLARFADKIRSHLLAQ
ncbi:MAG: NAD(P)H-dependent oxidoreductase [Candidatus Fimivivens sp.]|nr:NAD(P)H-dependent oxidoreductase [Candidatus Fimivivens sp.]